MFEGSKKEGRIQGVTALKFLTYVMNQVKRAENKNKKQVTTKGVVVTCSV